MATHPQKVLTESRGRLDRDSYSRLVKEYSRLVFSICYGIVGNLHDAEDLTQETFMKGYAGLHSLRDSGRFVPWIKKIARNVCIDFLRRQKIRPESLDATSLQPGEKPSISPEFFDVHRALQRLQEEHRLPLVLYYFNGRGTDEIAQTLGISREGVHVRLSRARRELRKLLEEGEE